MAGGDAHGPALRRAVECTVTVIANDSRSMSVWRGMERGVFTAYPRRVAAAKAKVLYVALKLRVRIVAIVRLGPDIRVANIPSMMRRDMAGNCFRLWLQTMTASGSGYAAVFRENRLGDNGAKNKHRTQRFHFRHDVSALV
jgi:hypothetical protein